MNLQQLKDLLYDHRYKIFLFGLLLVVLALGNMTHQSVIDAGIPSESKCHDLGYYNDYTMRVGSRWWCEYNETGWHFNKTKFNKEFNRSVT